MPTPLELPLDVAPEVAAALADGRPVVALESTIISHGLPRPDNHAAAVDFEERLRSAGVVPATVAVLDGRLKAGLSPSELARIASEDIAKLSVRDLPVVLARGGSGATTVAATSYVADRAGVRVFATGGLGGVHRDAPFDESADLHVLATVPITVVSAGVKSILDIPATLERLETLGVVTIGYGTDDFPSFWVTASGHRLDWSVASATDVAAVMRSRDALGLRAGILVANPLPASLQLDPAVHDAALATALSRAADLGLSGKAVTPYLLATMVELTGGASLAVNLDIARHNIAVAGAIATAFCT